MNLCVLLILLTAISTAHTGQTWGPSFRRFFGIKDTSVAKFQTGGAWNAILRAIFGIKKETEPQIQLQSVPEKDASISISDFSPTSTIFKSVNIYPDSFYRDSSSTLLNPEDVKSSSKWDDKYKKEPVDQEDSSSTDLSRTSSTSSYQPNDYEQPRLIRLYEDKKIYYADATFIGSYKSILVTAEPLCAYNIKRELYFPTQKETIAVDVDVIVVTRVYITRSVNVTLFKYLPGKFPITTLLPFAYKQLTSENDMPPNGFMLSGGRLYPCTIQKKGKAFVEITFQEEQPPIGSIKLGTPIIGKTGNDKGQDTLIAVCYIDTENLSKTMAVLTSALGPEEYFASYPKK